MQKRQLGNSSTMVSAIGIGAMSLTNFYGPIDKGQSHAILKKALDLGTILFLNMSPITYPLL